MKVLATCLGILMILATCLPAQANMLNQGQAELAALFPTPPDGWEGDEVVFLPKGAGKTAPVKEASRLYRRAVCAPGEIEITITGEPSLVTMVHEAMKDKEALEDLPGGKIIEIAGRKTLLTADSSEEVSLFIPLSEKYLLSIEAEALPKALKTVKDFANRIDLKRVEKAFK